MTLELFSLSLTRNEGRFDSMIYVGFSVQHIMSRSGFIVSAIIDTLQLSTKKQCFEWNRSLWRVRLISSIHNKDRTVRAVVSCVSQRDFGFKRVR